jgi:NuA3 HAT complex component NTO1
MKNAHGGIADKNSLKGFCDKHVPPDWRKEHGVDKATADAKEHYRETMKGRRWADSQQAALSMPGPNQVGYIDTNEDAESQGDAATSNKRKKGQVQKKIWRLPSGAPVVPHLVYHNVENVLIRWGIRKRKDFVAEACKYWTLKREARRGASLLKRLQLQLDTFTSMEMTRRNYVGMGSAGGPKLQRRIEFAERLEDDIEQIRLMCERTKEREEQKQIDVDILRNIVDTVYFPIPPLLWPILERAKS